MPANSKVTILLADEDALRRDGLAAVLSGTERFQIVAKVPDGEAALEQIRELRPDVAVVDLNLPKLHGIELVRRVRSETPGTKVLILGGTEDDEIVREVIRSGADGYLLKSGPPRHLIDAISYVRDGGQYFSPQLRRDGRDRHLLEEPPRPAFPQDAGRSTDFTDKETEARSVRPRKSGRRTNDFVPLRERLREEAAAEDLSDRDYEIMTVMADGIRPILDRLDEIDNRVAQMEVGEAPVPADPRRWLNSQLADTARDARSGADLAVLGRNVNELEARLPELIEEAVSKRFHQMAGKLQQEIEETHVRTLETFIKNVQVKLVSRVSALEGDMSKQAEAMNQLREYSSRTEDNLSRLIAGVDKLAQDLPKRLAAPEVRSEKVVPQSKEVIKKTRAFGGRNKRVKIFWAVSAGCVALGLTVWAAGFQSASKSQTTPGAANTEQARPNLLPSGADTKTRMQAAQEYVDRKEYAMAEDIYKQVVRAEPNNGEALTRLASVLYREDKIDESVSVLDRVPKN